MGDEHKKPTDDTTTGRDDTTTGGDDTTTGGDDTPTGGDGKKPGMKKVCLDWEWVEKGSGQGEKRSVAGKRPKK